MLVEGNEVENVWQFLAGCIQERAEDQSVQNEGTARWEESVSQRQIAANQRKVWRTWE